METFHRPGFLKIAGWAERLAPQLSQRAVSLPGGGRAGAEDLGRRHERHPRLLPEAASRWKLLAASGRFREAACTQTPAAPSDPAETSWLAPLAVNEQKVLEQHRYLGGSNSRIAPSA